MRTVFVDAAYFIALLSPRDQSAAAARHFTLGFVGRMITTTADIDELCNALSGIRTRRTASLFVSRFRARADVEIVHADAALWNRAFELYGARPDKDWSLTDCLSFLVMQDRSLTECVTTDHHFEQAGFTIVM